MSNQIELLTNNFNTLLTQYQNTYQEYLKSLDSKEQAMHYSNQLQQINNELTETNNTILNLVNNNYSESQKNNGENSEILMNNYRVLEEERLQIANIINQYDTINSAYENGKINLTSNYYSYIVYLFIALFLVLLLFKFNLSSSQTGGGLHHEKISPLLFLFLAFVIIFNAYIKIKY